MIIVHVRPNPGVWGIPGRREVELEPVMASKLPSRKRMGVLPNLFDPRPIKYRKLNLEEVEKF